MFFRTSRTRLFVQVNYAPLFDRFGGNGAQSVNFKLGFMFHIYWPQLAKRTSTSSRTTAKFTRASACKKWPPTTDPYKQRIIRQGKKKAKYTINHQRINPQNRTTEVDLSGQTIFCIRRPATHKSYSIRHLTS